MQHVSFLLLKTQYNFLFWYIEVIHQYWYFI